MAKRTSMHQYEPLPTPTKWGEEGRRFVLRLTEILDDIYRRYGRLGLKDTSAAFRDSFDGLRTAVNALKADKLDKESVVNNLTTEEAGYALDARQARALLLAAHPVGSIYMSADSTNPATLFGGTWVNWGAGRVPVGVDSGDADFNAADKTGGAKTHTLTVGQMPTHTHNKYDGANTATMNTSFATGAGFGLCYGDNAGGTQPFTMSTGGGNPHNNLQPYITCYMWRRTA